MRFNCPVFKRRMKNITRGISKRRKKRKDTSLGKIMS